NGERKTDRTGTGTISIFGAQTRYDLREGFPILTTKKVRFDAILRELLWFLRGSTNINDDLTQHTPMWDDWADKEGELGPVYGYQWRKWEKFEEDRAHKGLYKKTHIDQIQNVIDTIKNKPDSRRIIVTGWNVADVEKMALPPCHTLFQFNVANGHLDLQLYQRSADIALGVPYNIASYATLLMMVAHECNLKPRHFIHTLGDAHIYLNHIKGLKEQIKRTPRPLPQLKIADKSFWDLKFEDFELTGYKHDAFIKFPVAV
ncbi:thymidylate synthase, partial [Candidatus Peregrinibacteria bacterium]|nr:thymidylate synthase [Candidatus Peregrinibacteria bacterium]